MARAPGAVSQGKSGSTLKWGAAESSKFPVKQTAGYDTAGPRLVQAAPSGAYTPPGGAMSNPFGAPAPRPLPEAATDVPAASLPSPMSETMPGPLTPPPLPTPDTAYPRAGVGRMAPEGPGALTPRPHGTPGPNEIQRKCPSKDDKEFADFFKTIKDLSTDIAAKDGEFPKECDLGREQYQPRCWSQTDFMWKASGLCHKPLYFEDSHLERYGHSIFPHLQPVISGAGFFLTFPILPYKMGLEPPTECIYTLGYYRPGDCAPHMLDPIPLSVRAGLFEAGAWVAGAAIIP